MDERRKQPRIPVRALAEVRFQSWEIFRLIYTINISQGGMNLDLPGEKPPRIGSLLLVRMMLPKGPPLELEATVRHVTETTSTPRRCHVGVQFVSLDEAKRAAIEQTLTAYAGGPVSAGAARKKDS